MRIIFRADGNRELGIGSIKRVISLAKGLLKSQKHMDLIFLTRFSEGRKLLEEEGFKVETVKKDEMKQLRKLSSPDAILVTDLLYINPKYIQSIKEIVPNTVCIDNNTTSKKIESDILINARIFDEGEFKIIGDTRCYLGPKYVILGEEFERFHSKKKEIKDSVKSILVIFGGSDPNEYTVKVARALESIEKHISINLIIGPVSHYDPKRLTQDLSNLDRRFNVFFNPRNLISIMRESDIAVSAAGIVLYELSTLGVPSIVIPQRKHQEGIARAFERRDVCMNLSTSPSSEEIYQATLNLMNDMNLRKTFSHNGKSFVDGKGLRRVVDLILNL